MGNLLPIQLTFGVLLVTLYTFAGLLALWAATSRRSLLPIATVLTLLLPLLTIRAYELWGILTLQVCVIAVGVTIWRWRNPPPADGAKAERRSSLQFSLRTLLAAVPVVAIITAVATQVPRHLSAPTIGMVLTVCLNGICGGCAVLLGVSVLVARRRRVAWPSALALCLALAAAMAWLDWLFPTVTFWSDWPPHAAIPRYLKGVLNAPYPAWAWFAILPGVSIVTWSTIRLWRGGRAGSTGSVRRTVMECAFVLLVVAVALPPILVAWKLTHPTRMPDLPVPQPNGFDDILAAGREFHFPSHLGTSREPYSAEELSTEIAAHKWVYKRLRVGLSREVQVRDWTKKGIATEQTEFEVRHDLDWIVPNAAHALICEAEVAKQQDRSNDAAKIAVECIRLGQAITHNSLCEDYGVAFRSERMGDHMLHQVLPRLDAEGCRNTTAALVEIDQGREPVEDVWRRDRIWHENSERWFVRLRTLLVAVAYAGDSEKPCVVRQKEATTRLLILELALRAYQLERGTPPDRLEQLVPDFLASLPVDPFDSGGRPFRYTRSGDQCVVYSVGPDGDDDGARPVSRDRWGYLDGSEEGDFRLDVHLAPGVVGEDSANAGEQ